jgi:hypothetical protein
MVDQEEKQKKLGKVLTWMVGLIAVGLLSTFLMSVLKGLLSLAGAVIVTWILVLLVTQLVPFVTNAWLPNQMMKLYNWEAWRNPIETLRNDLKAERENLKEFNKDTTELDVQYQTFDSLVEDAEGVAAGRPATVALRQQATEFKQVLDEQREEAVRYELKLNDYEKEIDVAEVIYKASKAGTRLLKKISGANKRAYQEIMKKTAIASVKSSLAEMRAQLNTNRNMARAKLAAIQSGSSLPDQAALPAKSAVVTLPATTVQENMKVRR